MSATAQKDLESILAVPLTGLQTRLEKSLLAKDFSSLQFDTFLADLELIVPPSLQSLYLREKEKVNQAIVAGQLTAQPDFSSPELQLLWAAQLVFIAANTMQPLENTLLWSQLLECDDAKAELRKHAFYIARDAVNPSTRLKWGKPGSMFYSDPVNNQINIDFLMSLIGGFEDTRSIIFHEIGHSKLTRGYPKRMTEIRNHVEELAKRADAGQITPEEYTELRGLHFEWELRNALFQDGENSPVNRYSINTGRRLAQDFDLSLNIVETTIARAGETPLPVEDNPLTRFENMVRAVRMSLYKNNGLFEDSPQGWERVGVRPEWVQGVSKSGDPLAPEDAFQELMALCGAASGLEHLQPGTIDRMRGVDWLETVTTDFAERRNAIMEDEIWERFAEPFLRPVIEEMKQKLQEQMQQQAGQSKQNQGQPPQQGQGQQQGSQSGQGSGQSQGSSSQGQQGQGQGQGQVQGSGGGGNDGGGKSQRSQSGQGNQGGSEPKDGQSGGNGEAQEAGESQSGSNISDDAGKNENAEKSSKTQADGGKNSDAQDGDAAEQAGQMQVKGVGAMPKVEVPPVSPDRARAVTRKKNAQGSVKDAKDNLDAKNTRDDPSDIDAAAGKNENAQNSDAKKTNMPGEQTGKDPSAQKEGTQDADADSKDPAEGKSASDKEGQNTNKARVNESPVAAEAQPGGSGQSIEQLLKELDDAKREKLEVPLNEEGITALQAQGAPLRGRASGSSAVKTLPKIGDWGDYLTSVTLLGAEIRQARNLIVQIQEKQAKTTRNPTRMRSILPDDGDMERFDEVSHEALVTKLLTGQQIAEQDAQRFVIDEEEKTPASIDIVVGIDGSGSMYWEHDQNYNPWQHSPIQAGINIACILNEAAKKPRNHRSKNTDADINVWGMVWGNNPPSILMKPGDDPIKVGKAIAGLKNSSGWGTDLAPAIKHITKTLAEQKANPQTPVGFTHNIIVSDGDISDPLAASVMVDKMLENNRHTTFDVVIIQKGRTEMKNVVQAMQKKHGEARIKIVQCPSPEQAQSAILALLRERMMATGHSKAIPQHQKTRDFQKAYETMR